MSVAFTLSGHVLGAASARFQGRERSLLFSGDVGREDALLIPQPTPPASADYVVMESTYGGRSHPESDPFTALAEIASATLGRGGVLMIPAFAVGRSQAILYTIHRLTSEGRVPRAPVFLNTPMAIDVTDLYTKHTSYHRLSDEECQALRASATYVRSVTESKALNRSAGPMVIVAGAGMLSGGRILHHLKAFGGDPGNALVLVGYQAAGTRGAALLRGDDTRKIHGGHWPIRARVEKLDMTRHMATTTISWIG